MDKIRAAHRGKQRHQFGVPETFKDVILDSRRWHQERQEREAVLMENVSKISLYQ